jgi:hypothetical protein
VHLLVVTPDVEAPGLRPVYQQDVEVGVGPVPVVLAVLELELRAQERLDLLGRPGDDAELLRARAGVDPEQERQVVVARGSPADAGRRLVQPRGGKTPWSAMQYCSVR